MMTHGSAAAATGDATAEHVLEPLSPRGVLRGEGTVAVMVILLPDHTQKEKIGRGHGGSVSYRNCAYWLVLL